MIQVENRFTLARVCTLRTFYLFIILTLLQGGAAAEQRIGAVISEKQEIPHTYRSWSLFIICNPGWLRENKLGQLTELYRQFVAFGAAIGQKNIAVWFTHGENPDSAQEAASNYDVSRAVAYCEQYRLIPSKSPYVFVTTNYPGTQVTLENYYRVSLDSLDAETTAKVLQTLVDQIVLSKLDQDDIDTEVYWRKWETIGNSVTATTGSLLGRLAITIDTRFFKVELAPAVK